jgi:hypothetical protein
VKTWSGSEGWGPDAIIRRAARSRAAGDLVLRPMASLGYRRYLRSGRTGRLAYSAFRKLHESSPGAVARLADRAEVENPAGGRRSRGPGGLVDPCCSEALRALQTDGMYVLPVRLAPEACAELAVLAADAECVLVERLPGAPERARHDPVHPQAARYDVDEQQILSCEAAQRLLADESFVRLAEEYLGTTPIQDLVAMWWSSAVPGGASSAAAQLFHVDMDRLRFLKVFVYLSDVDERHGPHVFVRGSHRDLPRRLRADRRFSDAEVEEALPDRATTVSGPVGTIFVADTSGLHKGLPPEVGSRLVFQMQFSSSLFGAPYSPAVVADPIPELRAAVSRNPSVFRRYSLAER